MSTRKFVDVALSVPVGLLGNHKVFTIWRGLSHIQIYILSPSVASMVLAPYLTAPLGPGDLGCDG